jgi:hypothetical protein
MSEATASNLTSANSTASGADRQSSRYFYNSTTGVFSGESISGPKSWCEQQTREGHGAWDGAVDPSSFRVDIATGTLVSYQPPAPPDDPLRTFEWDGNFRMWRARPTAAGVWAIVRAERDKRLADCDWIVTKSAEAGVAVPTAWQAYRQALRDVPETNTDPTNITWPTPPT